MQTNLSLLTLAVFSLLCISSCGTEESTVHKESLAAPCFVLTETQINNYWVTEYTSPSNPENKLIAIIRFYVHSNALGIALSVQAFNSTYEPLGKTITISPGEYCDCELSHFMIGESYDVNWNDLKIINPENGQLVEGFNNIILRPQTETIPETDLNYLQFNLEVHIGNGEPERQVVLPCPPCINCKPRCEEAIVQPDSTNSN
jgi:hypothetical protein